MKKNVIDGFSLVEMVIVVAIVAVLAAIAMPNYEDYILRSNRAVGKAELMEVAARQEQFFVNNKTYTADLTNLGYPAASYYVTDDGDPQAASAGSIYQITATVSANGLAYGLEADSVNRQVKDTDCDDLGIDEEGQRYSKVTGNSAGAITGAAANDICW